MEVEAYFVQGLPCKRGDRYKGAVGINGATDIEELERVRPRTTVKMGFYSGFRFVVITRLRGWKLKKNKQRAYPSTLPNHIPYQSPVQPRSIKI